MSFGVKASSYWARDFFSFRWKHLTVDMHSDRNKTEACVYVVIEYPVEWKKIGPAVVIVSSIRAGENVLLMDGKRR